MCVAIVPPNGFSRVIRIKYSRKHVLETVANRFLVFQTRNLVIFSAVNYLMSNVRHRAIVIPTLNISIRPFVICWMFRVEVLNLGLCIIILYYSMIQYG